MTLRITALLALFVGTAFAAPVPKPKVKDDEAIQGKWKIVELQHDGKPATKEIADAIATFDKEKMIISSVDGKDRVETMGYKLDSSKKEIDITTEAGGNMTLQGVYELDGDTLLIAVGKPPVGGRPKEVKTGMGVAFLKLTRIKEEKK